MKRRGSLTVDIVFIALAALGTAVAHGLNIRTFAVAALVGAFAGYLVLFHGDDAPHHRTYARVTVGVLFGMAVATIYRGSLALWVGAIVCGAILGYFGSRWAKHLS